MTHNLSFCFIGNPLGSLQIVPLAHVTKLFEVDLQRCCMLGQFHTQRHMLVVAMWQLEVFFVTGLLQMVGGVGCMAS